MNETSGLCKQARAVSAEQAGQCQGVPGVRGAVDPAAQISSTEPGIHLARAAC